MTPEALEPVREMEGVLDGNDEASVVRESPRFPREGGGAPGSAGKSSVAMLKLAFAAAAADDEGAVDDEPMANR